MVLKDKEIELKSSPNTLESSQMKTTVSVNDDGGTISDETDIWPVPTQLLDNLEAIKTTYMVNPLKVYIGNQFIKPLDVTKALDSALIAVHFTI